MRRALLSITLVLTGMAAGLLLSELTLRIVRFSYPPFHRPDLITGLSLRSNTSGWYGKEGHAYVTVNSQGLRDRERSIEKPPGTYRILVLGDSYVEALQVDIEKTFWRLLEKRLQECKFRPAKNIDVINLGVSGFGTGQALRALQTRGLAYAPDLVILAVFPGNDIRNNSRELEPDKLRPFYFLGPAGTLVLDDTFANSSEFRRRNSWIRQAGKELSKYLRSLQLGYYVKDLMEIRRAAVPRAMKGPGQPQVVGEMGLDDQVFFEPQDEKWQRAWQVTERLILELKKTAESAGSEFLLAIFSIGIQVHPEKAVREGFARRLGLEDLHYPDRRLSDFGQRENIQMINLTPTLAQYAEERKIYLHGFANTSMGAGHWNEAGHSAAAEIIGTQLCRVRPRG